MLDVTEQLHRYGTAIETALLDESSASADSVSNVPVVALIDEPSAATARRDRSERATVPHLRRLVAIPAAVVVALVVAGIAININDGSRIATTAPTPTTPPPYTAPPRAIPLPPEGATPSAPTKGVLVLSLQACEGPSSLPWSGNLALYADGRLLWHTNDDPFEGDPTGGNGPRPKTAWLEQRLTPEGTELLRSELVSSGLLRPLQPGNYSCPLGSYRAEARIGDRNEIYVGKLPRDLVERIAEPASWLPARAWEDRAVRPFVPATYAVCITGLDPQISVANIAAALPTRVGNLVRAGAWGANHTIGPSRWLWCTEMATEDARTFAEALDAAAIDRNEHPTGAGPEYLFEYQDASPSALLRISFWAGLPDQPPSGLIMT